jgi:hypothetical protein
MEEEENPASAAGPHRPNELAGTSSSSAATRQSMAATTNTTPPPQQQGQQNLGGRHRVGMYSNKLKKHNNLYYCYSCGYNVDHPGSHCPNTKPHQDPHAKRDNAHLLPNASMVAQHKTMPDGTGAGLGWNIAQLVDKAQCTMRDMQNYRQQQQRQQQQGGYQQQQQWQQNQGWQRKSI